MRRSDAARALAAILLVWGLFPTVAEAQERQLVFDSEGTVYRLHRGTYGELFPEGTAAHADNPVLALEVIPAEGDAERLLVPATESYDSESSASLVYEKGAGTVFLLWQTAFNGLHPLFQLTSFDGTAWSEVIEIAYGPFIRKGSPRLAVTRETAADGAERTLLQLIWWEEVPGAVSRKRYAPIFLEGEGYSGNPPVIDLSSFLPAADEAVPAADETAESDAALPAAAGLEDALTLRAGRNDHSVVVGFLDPDDHRLATLEVELLPWALSDLADKVRAHVVVVGNRYSTRGELAEDARTALLELGTGFHEAARRFLADEVRGIVESSPEDPSSPEGLEMIADKIRAHVVVVGSRFRVAGLEDTHASDVLEIPSSDGGFHALNVSVISNRVAPDVGGSAELFLSESGRNVIVTWEGDGVIHYRESAGDGWSEPGVIELTEDLDRDAVYQMLSERVRTD